MARALMMQRVRAARTWRGDGIEKAQRRVLAWLTRRGAVTEYGRGRIVSTDDADVFRRAVPTVAYADIRPLVLRMIDGQSNILWPGKVRRYAQSSGTGDGRSKYIPISNDSLRLNHYRGATDAVAHYLALYPDSRMFSGKGFILGGSFANTLDRPAARGVKVGDLSANLIDDINPVVNLVRVPSKHVALMEDWTLKVPALVRAARGANVTNISGVPSWFMTVIKEVIKSVSGAETIHDVWPNLEVFSMEASPWLRIATSMIACVTASVCAIRRHIMPAKVSLPCRTCASTTKVCFCCLTPESSTNLFR